MKSALIFIAAVLIIVGCKGTNSAESTTTTKSAITPYMWSDSVASGAIIGTKKIGKLTDGEKVEISFAIKNNDTKPLIILSVTPSCGCTSIEGSLEPIASGQQRDFKVVYDTKGKYGTQLDQLVFKTTQSEFKVMLDSFVESN